MIIKSSGDNNALIITNNGNVVLDIRVDHMEVTLDVMLFVQNIATVEAAIKAHVAKLLEQARRPTHPWDKEE